MRKSVLFLIFMSLLLAVEPAMANDPALVKKGYRYIDKGYVKNALPTFQRAVKMYPENPRAHFGLALAADKQGGQDNFDIAIIHYKKTLELDPANLEAKANLARLLSWNLEAREQSLTLYKEVLIQTPNNNKVKEEYAEVLTWAGRSYEAKDLFKTLYQDNPDDINLRIKYANALANSGLYYESFDLYRSAIKAKHKFDNYTAINYARTLSKSGYSDVSIEIYNDILGITKEQKDKINIYKELAGVLFDSGRYQEAVDIDKLIEPKDKDILLRMARSYEKLGYKQDALKLYEDLYNTYSYDPDIKRSAAIYLSSVGGYNINASKIYNELLEEGYATLDDKISLAYLYNAREATRDQAITLFRDILDDPNLTEEKSGELTILLAKALASAEGTRPESIQLYRQILLKNPDNLELKLPFLELLSWQESTRKESLLGYYELIGQYPNNPKIQNGFNQTLVWYLPSKGDLKLYEEILLKYPNNLNALKGLNYILSQNPDIKDDVLESYKAALTKDPGNEDLQLKIADILAQQKATRKEAIEIYKNVYNQRSDDPELMQALANNLLYEKKFKEARDIYENLLTIAPDNKDALLGKARIYGWQGLNLAALKAYEKAYEMYPNDPDIAYEYAGIAKKLGKNGRALEVLKSIKEKSSLPDAPGLPQVAMAVNYQMMSVDNNYSSNGAFETPNLENLQNDLANIQQELEKLQNELNTLEEKNDNVLPVVEPVLSETSFDDFEMNYRDNTQVNYSNNNVVVSEESINSPFNNSSILDDDILPEPVLPAQSYNGRVYYSPQLSVLDTFNEQKTDLNFREVSLNSEDQPNIFRVTGFQDALSGRRYSLMQEQFGQIEKDIMYLMRPEIRTSFVLSNEAGDPTSDGLEIHGFPSFVSFNITPQNRFRFGYSAITYGMDPRVHPASITASSYTLGLNSKPHERVTFDGEITINSFSDPQAPVDVTANADLMLRLHDRVLMNLGYRREPLYQSVLETTGYTQQPQYSRGELLNIFRLTSDPRFSPNNTMNFNLLRDHSNFYNSLRGPFVGQVRDNAVSAELTILPFNKWDVTGGFEYSAVRGENVQNNSRTQALFSFGRTFTGVKNHLFRVGYQFLYFGYNRDLSAYPSMTPYPYTQNGGQLIPVTRQMSYDEARRIASARIAHPNDVLAWANAGFPAVDFANNFMSPVDFIRAPRGVGIGGYFSPKHFFLNSFRLDFEGKLWDGRIYYKGGGSLGVQQVGDRVNRMDLLAARGLEGYANIPAGDPRRANPIFAANATAADNIRDNTDPTSLASAFDLTLFLRVTDFLTLYSGVDYMNTGAFDRWRYNGGLIIRPKIDALSPIFRKPKAASPEEDNK